MSLKHWQNLPLASQHWTCNWTQIRKVKKGLFEGLCTLSDVFIHVQRIRIHKHFAIFFECNFFSLLFLARPCQYSKILLHMTYYQQNSMYYITQRNYKINRNSWLYKYIDGYQKTWFFKKLNYLSDTTKIGIFLFKYFYYESDLVSNVF